ncbi:MAG: hypothetical protein AAFR65_11070 [Pseudomonadota bacterium]
MPDIHLPETVSDKSQIPAGFVAAYEPKDGVYTLHANGVDGLAKNAQTLLAEKKDLQAKHSVLTNAVGALKSVIGEEDAEPTALADLVTKRLAEASGDDGAAQRQIDAIKAEHAKVLGEKDQRIDLLNRGVEKNLYEGTIKALLVKHGATDEGVAALPQLMRTFVKGELQGDASMKFAVLGEDMQPAYSADGPETLDHLVERFKEKYKSLFKPSSDKKGGGAPSISDAVRKAKDPNQMTLEEKAAFISLHGQAEFNQLTQRRG